MPQYMLLLRSDISHDFTAISPDEFGSILAEYAAWSGRLEAEGRLALGHKLKDEGGRVLRAGRPGQPASSTDGPYIETKEVMGGYYVISADDYDHAERLCLHHPHFRFGSIEIREVDPMGASDG